MNKSTKGLRLVALALAAVLIGAVLGGAADQTRKVPKKVKPSGSTPELLRAQAPTKPHKKPGENAPASRMTLVSEAFTEGESIPLEFSCDGKDLSPPLAWDGAPEGTSAFVLTCDDPDAPAGTWDHWVIFNLPGSLKGLPAGVTPETELGKAIDHGQNSWGRVGYGGPCPPGGKPHRYFFRLYALSAPVRIEGQPSKVELLEAIKPSILATASLMGTYGR